MSWSRSLSGFSDEVEKNLTQRQKDIAVYALNQVIFGSPVDTGTFRGNHRVTVNGVTGEFNLKLQDKNGQQTLLDGMQQIGTISKPFGEITIQNNLPYSEALESGHSGQAPAGVYSVAFNSTVERFGR